MLGGSVSPAQASDLARPGSPRLLAGPRCDAHIVKRGAGRWVGVYRTYFRVVLDDGRIVTMFVDRETGRWYEQGY